MPTNDLGPFAPSGEPEKLSDRGTADAEGTSGEFDAALAEFAPLGAKRRLGSVKNDGERVTIPSEKAGPYKSPPVG